MGNENAHRGERVWNSVPNYSTDIKHSWLLITKLEDIDPRAFIRISNGDSDSMDVNILGGGLSPLATVDVRIEDGSFADAPLAICQACLLAIAVYKMNNDEPYTVQECAKEIVEEGTVHKYRAMSDWIMDQYEKEREEYKKNFIKDIMDIFRKCLKKVKL